VTDKICAQCRQAKPRSGFGNLTSSKDGLRRLCKDCWNWGGKMRRVWVTRENLAKLNNTCPTCGHAFDEPGHHDVMEHDHATMTFRGILCHSCNIKLSGCKDDKDALLSRAIRETDDLAETYRNLARYIEDPWSINKLTSGA
jgi:hypothetical protein